MVVQSTVHRHVGIDQREKTLKAPGDYEGLKVLIVRENWLGCTGLSAFDACLRLGAQANSLSESEYVPGRWTSISMRVAGRLLRKAAVAEFNRNLVREVEWRRPDLLLVFKGPWVTAEALQSAKRTGTKTYCFYPDVSYLVHGPYLPEALREYDWIFTTKTFGVNDFKERLGLTKVSFLPHAFDLRVHRPRKPTKREEVEYGCDVSFIGTWSPKKEALLEQIATLRPEIDLKVWGDQWRSMRRGTPLERHVQFRGVHGIDYAIAIGCSKINLAILSEQRHGSSSGDLITSRTFHIPASGGLMLHERTPDLEMYFTPGQDCACFSSAEEMIEQIDRLLGDAALRQSIAAKGQERVEAEHSWDHRMATILDHFLSERNETPDTDCILEYLQNEALPR